MKQKVNCKVIFEEWYLYTSNKEKIYTCWIQNQNINENAELEFIVPHTYGRSNSDITALIFLSCTISKVPQELTKTFPNLKILDINNSKLKHVERKNLKDLSQLKILSFRLNEITYLPEDLLADMKNLEIIDFFRNNIKVIEPNLLDGLNKLIYVNISWNPCFEILFDSINNRGKTFEEIKEAIRQKYLIEASAKLKQEIEISNDLKRVILNNKLKDFSIKVEDEEFKVHKLVLAARSPVLSEMIESNVNAVSLKLDNISTEIFRVILNFIYTGELPTFDHIDFVNLFMAADKLKIEKLKEFAAENLIEKIDADNAFDMLTLANNYDHEKIRQKSFEQAKKILNDDDIDEELVSQPDLLKKALVFKNEIDKNVIMMNDILKNSRKRKSDSISK